VHLQAVPGVPVVVVPSTFVAGQEGPFFLKVASLAPVTVARLQ
jgi:hypothetical protein